MFCVWFHFRVHFFFSTIFETLQCIASHHFDLYSFPFSLSVCECVLYIISFHFELCYEFWLWFGCHSCSRAFVAISFVMQAYHEFMSAAHSARIHTHTHSKYNTTQMKWFMEICWLFLFLFFFFCQAISL